MASPRRRPGGAPSPNARVTAVVLAAGSSSRMGRPKPLVSVLGQPLLARVLEMVRRVRPSETVVVLGADAERIRKEIDLRTTTVVVNPHFEEGMSSSLRLGTASAKPSSGPLLVVLGDQPFVHPATVKALVDRHAAGSAKILVPTFEGVRGNPILLDRALVPELDSLRGDIGCRAIFPGHSAELAEVPVGDPGILIDVDTPVELARLEQTLEGNSQPTAETLRPLVAGRLALHHEGPVRGLSRVRFPPDVLAPATPADGGGKPHRPEPELLIVGEAAVAKALAALGGFLGYRVTVVAPGARASDFPDGIQWEPDLERLPVLVTPGTFAVIASTGVYDETALTAILPKSPRYVGLVLSRPRGKALIDSLKARGLPDARLKQIHHPAGLDIAAHDPEEIALSILSEITKLRRSDPTPGT